MSDSWKSWFTLFLNKSEINLRLNSCSTFWQWFSRLKEWWLSHHLKLFLLISGASLFQTSISSYLKNSIRRLTLQVLLRNQLLKLSIHHLHKKSWFNREGWKREVQNLKSLTFQEIRKKRMKGLKKKPSHLLIRSKWLKYCLMKAQLKSSSL